MLNTSFFSIVAKSSPVCFRVDKDGLQDILTSVLFHDEYFFRYLMALGRWSYSPGSQLCWHFCYCVRQQVGDNNGKSNVKLKYLFMTRIDILLLHVFRETFSIPKVLHGVENVNILILGSSATVTILSQKFILKSIKVYLAFTHNNYIIDCKHCTVLLT